MTQDQIRFIENNLQLSNRELAESIGSTRNAVQKHLQRNQIRRDDEQIRQILSRFAAQQTGERNPNYKKGISKNNYHYKLIQKERYPERIKARDAVKRAKEKGLLIPQPCKICGSEENIQAHHYKGYAEENFLDVEFYCRACHREIERASNVLTDASSNQIYKV